MEKHVRDFEQVLKEGGLRLLSLSRTGKGHYKATIESPDKRRMVYILASSTSDGRSSKNYRADINRFFNN